MIRHRVAIPTLRRSAPDISLALAGISSVEEGLSVQGIVAQVIKDIIREKPPAPLPSFIYTPFISAPAFSGADTSIESDDNKTVVKEGVGGYHITSRTILLPSLEGVPMRWYLTGGDGDIAVTEGQMCKVKVDGKGGKKGRVERDDKGNIYLSVLDNGSEWITNHPDAVIKLSMDHFFS